MILLTVGETWPVLGAEARLLAGAAGLGREVAWAVGARPGPPLFPALKGGELALANGPALGRLDPPTALAELITVLAQREAAGLLVRAPLLAADQAEAVAVAEHAAFPLILVPAGVSLSDIERAVTTLVRERRDDLYTRTTALHDLQVQLAAGAGAGRVLPLLVELLARLTGHPTAVASPPGALDLAHLALPPGYDEAARLLLRRAWATSAEAVQAGLPAPSMGRAAEPPVQTWPLPALAPPAALHPHPPDLLTAPVLGPDSALAVLVQWCAGGATGLDRLTLARAASIAAVEAERDRLARRGRPSPADQGGSLFLQTLLSGSEGNEADLRAQAQGYRLPIARGYAVARVAPAAGQGGGAQAGRALEEWAAQVGREDGSGALGRMIEGQLILLWPLDGPGAPEQDRTVPPPARLRQVAEAARHEWARRSGGPVTAGLGRGHGGLGGIARSAHEAAQAIILGRRVFGGEGTWSYDDLGIYRLLLPLRAAQAGELRLFVADTLGPLASDPRAMHVALLTTLAAYLAHGGNASQTAAALHLHRNTLAYRLRRIGQITGLDVDDPEARLRLALALKVRQLL